VYSSSACFAGTNVQILTLLNAEQVKQVREYEKKLRSAADEEDKQV
jgi:hypothetical protein